MLIVVLFALAVVAALPTEDRSENEDSNSLPILDAEAAGVDIDYANGLVRDKRQYGGN